MNTNGETLRLGDFAYGNEYVYNAIIYEDAFDLILGGFLGLCTCGMPEYTAKHIWRGLHLIDETPPDDLSHVKCELWFKKHNEKALKIFGSEDAQWFFYHWSEHAGLTEHGSSVPGWLSQKGRDIMNMLDECFTLKENI